MFDIERWQEIFETIRKNKLRTFLTGLSVASGIFILVILLGFGQGMQNGIAQEFEDDASNRIVVWTQVTTKEFKGLNPGRSIQMRNGDYDHIETRFADQLEGRSARFRVPNAMVNYKKESVGYSVQGIHSGYQQIENQYMSQGRYINYEDHRNVSKVAVISNTIKREIFKNGDDPLNEYLDISGIKFKIVGVYGDRGGEREEERIFIPMSTAQRVFNGSDRVNNLYYTLKPVENLDQAVAESMKFSNDMKRYLQEVHTVAPDDDSAINVFNTLEEVKRFFNLISGIKMFFWFVGICTIIAGVVGVSNIMLIVVKERTREIGVRKALGAKPWSIVGMILHEAIFVTAISGFAGLIFSMGLLEVFGPYIEVDYILNPSVNFNVALSTVFVLIFAGAVAGFFPAWRAANIHVIDALRDE
ncbi:ABC transporter permease [Maribacter sp. TH_r10]|uniref:FtsX-like permease family protein n=1 Tax=Maribacter luteus TaxID=2594478 RepID=A0A6I2ML82_9FLAO|nr:MULTISPECIES: ABC transporter permease [Maribacter]MDV7139986.1 ABC transporter permease [Maribacter sp. TH_r10]MRX63369.1 FtsX-like permease family protein [Maribacter luteus]|tara:strand:- start:557 stop:1804 length:1248 start_codon:yes stop_codon:yes gene_type:complete